MLGILADCLLSAVLLIVAPPDRAVYEHPATAGFCLAPPPPVTMYVNGSRCLIILNASNRYEIPLPPMPGTYRLQYLLGAELARMQRTNVDPNPVRIGAELVNGQWFTVMVRMGPKHPV